MCCRLYRPRARRDGARQVQRDARALGRPRRDGLPQLPPGARHPVRRRDGQELEPQDLQAHPRAGRRRLDDAGGRARALPGRRRHGRDGALLAARWRSRRPRRSRSSAAAPRPASSRSRPTSTPTRRCRAASRQEPLSREAADLQGEEQRQAVWNSILEQGGSVQHLDFLTAEEKATCSRPASRSTSAG
jgi:hypothetical protein